MPPVLALATRYPVRPMPSTRIMVTMAHSACSSVQWLPSTGCTGYLSIQLA